MSDFDVPAFFAAARRGLDLLAALVRDQPDPDRFYYRMDVEGNLRTDVPAGKQLQYFVDATRTGQIYFNPGIALIFLTHLYRATNQSRYLDAGKTLLDFSERCAEDVYRFPPSGKLGYGCALFHALTGEQRARRAAANVASYLAETQQAEGFWRLPDVPVYQAIEEKDDPEIRLDVTAEFSIFLLEIAALL